MRQCEAVICYEAGPQKNYADLLREVATALDEMELEASYVNMTTYYDTTEYAYMATVYTH